MNKTSIKNVPFYSDVADLSGRGVYFFIVCIMVCDSCLELFVPAVNIKYFSLLL